MLEERINAYTSQFVFYFFDVLFCWSIQWLYVKYRF